MTMPAYSTIQWIYLGSGSLIGESVLDPFKYMNSVVLSPISPLNPPI